MGNSNNAKDIMNYKSLTYDQFKDRYSDAIQDDFSAGNVNVFFGYDKLTGINVDLHYHKLGKLDNKLKDQFITRLKQYGEIQYKKQDMLVPVIAWMYLDQSDSQGQLTMAQPSLTSLSNLPQSYNTLELLKQTMQIWSLRPSLNQFLSLGYRTEGNRIVIQGFFNPDEVEDKIKFILFNILGLQFNAEDVYTKFVEVLSEYYPQTGQTIGQQFISYFKNEVSLELTFQVVFNQLQNQQFTLNEAKALKEDCSTDFGKSVIQMVPFNSQVLVVLQGKIQVRDWMMGEIQFINLDKVLYVEVLNQTTIFVATSDNLQVYMRLTEKLELVHELNISNLKVSGMKYSKLQNALFLFGRVREFSQIYNQIQVLWLEEVNAKEFKIKLTTKNLVKPGSSGWCLVNNDNNFLTVRQRGVIQKWKIDEYMEHAQQIDEQRGPDDYLNVILQLSNGNVVTGGNEGNLVVWGYQCSQMMYNYQCPSGVTFITETTEKQIITGHADGSVMFWNINEGLKQFHSFKAHELQISSIMKATNSDGRYLITSSWDGLVKMWKGAIKQ